MDRIMMHNHRNLAEFHLAVILLLVIVGLKRFEHFLPSHLQSALKLDVVQLLHQHALNVSTQIKIETLTQYIIKPTIKTQLNMEGTPDLVHTCKCMLTSSARDKNGKSPPVFNTALCASRQRAPTSSRNARGIAQ